MDKRVTTIKDNILEAISSQLVSDKSIKWDQCAEALDEIADYCNGYADTIREENEK